MWPSSRRSSPQSACFIGFRVTFDRLVNIIYVINGYVGILLLGIMLIRSARRIATAKVRNNVTETE
jgi:uncharacterized membrane protein YkvI